jgi:hypothetical protein
VIDATLETPVQPPELSDGRLDQMRTHLLDEIKRDARRRERGTRLRSRATGQRRLLAVVGVALAAIYTLPAVAEDRALWWIDGADDGAQPLSQVVTLARWTSEQLMIGPEQLSAPTARVGAGGGHWIMQAFVSKDHGLCIAMSPDPTRPSNDGASLSCGFPVHGLGSAGAPSDEVHWVGFRAGIPGKVTSRAAKFMYGPAAESVRHVDLENNDSGRVIRVATLPAPEGLGVRARFWFAVLRADDLVHTIVPRDEEGAALEHWRLPTAQ